MKLLVQKFGGTSVQSKETREKVIYQIKKAQEKEYKLIVVVSALGRKPAPYATDSLLELIGFPDTFTDKREQDLLMACGEVISAVVLSNELKEVGLTSQALTGGQAGITTTDSFNQANIKEIQTDNILTQLEQNDVVVVAGFQGQTEMGEITTIGRGGSDTTAAALGQAFDAERIDIFTDVNGIMTADPSVVKEARLIETVSYRGISNLAYQGAKVVHPRAVEIARQANIPMRVRSVYTDDAGTMITDNEEDADTKNISDRLVTGITYTTSITQIKIRTKEAITSSMQSNVFKAMAEAGISVDFINISPMGVVYTVPDQLAEKAVQILKTLGYSPEITKGCAKVSVVGAGIQGVPGVASEIVRALTQKDIQILQAADSHTTIWVLVHDKDLVHAVNALHDVFVLNR